MGDKTTAGGATPSAGHDRALRGVTLSNSGRLRAADMQRGAEQKGGSPAAVGRFISPRAHAPRGNPAPFLTVGQNRLSAWAPHRRCRLAGRGHPGIDQGGHRAQQPRQAHAVHAVSVLTTSAGSASLLGSAGPPARASEPHRWQRAPDRGCRCRGAVSAELSRCPARPSREGSSRRRATVGKPAGTTPGAADGSSDHPSSIELIWERTRWVSRARQCHPARNRACVRATRPCAKTGRVLGPGSTV
jgi:hypothetical protein